MEVDTLVAVRRVDTESDKGRTDVVPRLDRGSGIGTVVAEDVFLDADAMLAAKLVKLF